MSLAKAVGATTILAVFLLAATLPAQACFAPPPELTKPKRLLVADANQIAWARALAPRNPLTSLGALGEPVRFEVIEVIKGRVPEIFILENGQYATPGTKDWRIGDDFDGHRDGNLLAVANSRVGNDADCQIRPVFVAGESYLIFLDHPHWAAYEIVRSEDDLWLQKVRELVGR